MAYLGRQPVLGNFVKLDAITVVNGQAAYTMQNSGVNFTSYDNVNQFLVSLNGILQAPTDSFTVSGSTLTFASNLATGDVIDFVMVLGNTLDIGTPSDNTVTTAKLASTSVTAAKLNNDIISGTTALTSEPADTDEFLVSDAGTLKRIDYSLIKGGGITEADNWRLTANTNAGTDGFVTSNWERSDSNGYTKIGTGLSESSGVFSFATTGIYLITYHAQFLIHGGEVQAVLSLNTTINNSSYVDVCHAIVGNGAGTDGIRGSASSSFIFDVTDISNCKFKFETESMNLTTALVGNTSHSFTSFTTVRLGDT